MSPDPPASRRDRRGFSTRRDAPAYPHNLIISACYWVYDKPMEADDLLLVVLTSGAALTCFYLIAEYFSWQSIKAFDLKAMLDLRELYKKVHASTKPYIARAIRRK